MKKILCIVLCVVVLASVLCVSAFADIGDTPTGTDFSANVGFLLLTFEKDHNYGTDCPNILLREYGTDSIIGQYPSYPLFSGICFTFIPFGTNLDGKTVYVASGFTVDTSLNITEYYKGNYSYLGYAQYGYGNGIPLSVGSLFWYNGVTNANFGMNPKHVYDITSLHSSISSYTVNYFPVTSNFNSPWILGSFTSNLPCFVDLRFYNMSQVIYYKTSLSIVGSNRGTYQFDCSDDTYDGDFTSTGGSGFVFRGSGTTASDAIDTKTNYSNWASNYWCTVQVTGEVTPFIRPDPFSSDYAYYVAIFRTTTNPESMTVDPKVTFSEIDNSSHKVEKTPWTLDNMNDGTYWYYFTVWYVDSEWLGLDVRVQFNYDYDTLGGVYEVWYRNGDELRATSWTDDWDTPLMRAGYIYSRFPTNEGPFFYRPFLMQNTGMNDNVSSYEYELYVVPYQSAYATLLDTIESPNLLGFEIFKGSTKNHYGPTAVMTVSIESDYIYDSSYDSLDGLFVLHDGKYYYKTSEPYIQSELMSYFNGDWLYGFYTYSVVGPSFAQPWIDFHTNILGHMFEYFEKLGTDYRNLTAFVAGILFLCGVTTCVVLFFKRKRG